MAIFKNKKILLIEDERDLIMIYRKKLENEGYQVVAIDDIGRGIKAVKEEKPDLILLDLVFPMPTEGTMTTLSPEPGYNFLKALKSFSGMNRVPVIVITNISSSDDQGRSLKLGAKDFIVKMEKTPAEVAKIIDDFFAQRGKN